jgi:Uma2 family endonuclease
MLGHHALHHSAEESHLMGMPAVPDSVTTIDELLALPDDGLRHELLDGIHVVTPAPAYPHQAVHAGILAYLHSALRGHDGWQVLSSLADIVLGAKTLVQPDLFVIRFDPEHAPTSWVDAGVPVLAIEILSQSTAAHERVTKRHLCQRAGVSEYWIVDVASRLIERWRPDDDRPEVCDRMLEWKLTDGPTGTLDLSSLLETEQE